MSRLCHVVWRKIHLMNASLGSEVRGRGVTGSCRTRGFLPAGTAGDPGWVWRAGWPDETRAGPAPHGARTKHDRGEPQATVSLLHTELLPNFTLPALWCLQTCCLELAQKGGGAPRSWGLEHQALGPSSTSPPLVATPSFLIFNYQRLITFVLPMTSSI